MTHLSILFVITFTLKHSGINIFYVSESKMLLCVFLGNIFQCILIRSISQKLPFDFLVTFYSMLMLQQIHEPNACGTERYSTTVGGSSSVLVLSRMRGGNFFQMSGTCSRARFTETAQYLYQRMSQYNIRRFIYACV